MLAVGEPAETAATVARLVSDGATRHEAIHAVASVVAAEVFEVMHNKRSYDRDRVSRTLAQLRARDWHAPGA